MITPLKIKEIPLTILKRHFGVSSPVTEVFEVGFMGNLGSIIECFTENEENFYLWGIEKENEWYWGMTVKSAVEWLLGSSLVRSDFELTGEKIHSKITSLERASIDSTNLHYIIRMKNGIPLHVKEYSRKDRGAIELEIGAALGKKGLFPKVEKGLFLKLPGFRKIGIIGFFEHLEGLENIDKVSFEYLRSYFSKGTKDFLDQYFELKNDVLGVIKKFHHASQEFGSEKYSKHTLVDRLLPVFSSGLEKIGLDNKKKEHLIEILESKIKGELLIHGDIWWRQFEKIVSSNRIILLDLEDMIWGSPLFDYASFYNGIDNQLEYVKIYSEWGDITSKVETIKEKMRKEFLDRFGEDFYVFVLARSLQELEYSLERFGENHWLPRFLMIKTRKLSETVYKN